jgi:hypothetical protein
MNQVKVPDRQQIQPAGIPQHLLDLTVSSHGSISLFHPLTDLAREGMDAHCPADDSHQYFCGALVVEPRYAEDLLAHAVEDGLCV